MSATLAAHLERDDRDALSTQPARFRAQVTSARQQALRTGQVVTVDVADGGNRGDRSRGRLPSTYVVTAFPDGSVLAESLPLAGVVLNQLNGSLMKEGRNAAP
jgi:hypothetical protein